MVSIYNNLAWIQGGTDFERLEKQRLN